MYTLYVDKQQLSEFIGYLEDCHGVAYKLPMKFHCSATETYCVLKPSQVLVYKVKYTDIGIILKLTTKHGFELELKATD